jgi:hypothetical protein
MIKNAALTRRQKDAVVQCEIELIPAPGTPGRYLVNLRQGLMGNEWRETSLTPQPVRLADAETLFQQALAERRAQGFADPADALPSKPSEPHALTDADTVILQRLERGSWSNLKQHQRNRTI